MSKKFDPQAPSGRIAFDSRGNAVWEWRTQTGDFKSDVDTQTVKALQEDTSGQLGVVPTPTPNSQKVSHDPYSTADGPRAPQKRRTLDDMRKLSEEIKRTRQGKKAP
ncbi:MAG TPA: hypothetical protein VI653_15905 [Steroidobacteraceae bacterium]